MMIPKIRIDMLKLFSALAALAWILGNNTHVSAGDLATKRYIDPKGFFQLVPPTGWKVQEYPQDARRKVAFSAPEVNVDLRVLVNSVDFSTVEALGPAHK
jgi:hypothetical protein